MRGRKSGNVTEVVFKRMVLEVHRKLAGVMIRSKIMKGFNQGSAMVRSAFKWILKKFGGSVEDGFVRDKIRGRERQGNMPPMVHVVGKGDKGPELELG